MSSSDMAIGTRYSWINRFIALADSVDNGLRKRCGLTSTQARILLYVNLHDPKPIGKVGSALYLKPSTITAASNHLVEDGYATRSFDELDRRNVKLCASGKGADALPDILSVMQEVFDDSSIGVTALSGTAFPLSYIHSDGADVTASRIAGALGLDVNSSEVRACTSAVSVVEGSCIFLSELSDIDRSLDLSPNEGRVLRFLASGNKDCRLKDISASVGIRPNVISVSVGSLATRELLTKVANEGDRRSAKVSLTRKGARLMHVAEREYCDAFDAFFPRLAVQSQDDSVISNN